MFLDEVLSEVKDLEAGQSVEADGHIAQGTTHKPYPSIRLSKFVAKIFIPYLHYSTSRSDIMIIIL